MKKRIFVFVVLAAIMLLASLSTSMAGTVHFFDKETSIWNTYVLLAEGQRQDHPSTKASVRVNEFVGYNPTNGSISFYCKLEAKIGGRWQQVTDVDLVFAADRGEYARTNLMYYYPEFLRKLPNGTQLRAYGRSGQYMNREPMRGSVNFN